MDLNKIAKFLGLGRMGSLEFGVGSGRIGNFWVWNFENMAGVKFRIQNFKSYSKIKTFFCPQSTMNIAFDDFQKGYKFLRRSTELAAGDWDLYKNIGTSEKNFVKEIQFYDEEEARFFINGILETAKHPDLRGCLLELRLFSIKTTLTANVPSFKVYLIYEFYEYT